MLSLAALPVLVALLVPVVSALVLARSRTCRTVRAVGDRLMELRTDPARAEAPAGRQLRMADAVVEVDDWISPRRGGVRKRRRWPGSRWPGS